MSLGINNRATFTPGYAAAAAKAEDLKLLCTRSGTSTRRPDFHQSSPYKLPQKKEG
jgi:hypothetical protein